MDFLSEEQKRKLDEVKQNNTTYEDYAFDSAIKQRDYVEGYMESKAEHRLKTKKDFEDKALTEKEQKKLDNAWKKNKKKYSDSFKKKRLKMYEDYQAGKQTEYGNINADRQAMLDEKAAWATSESATLQKQLNDTLIAEMTDQIGKLSYIKSTLGDNEEAKQLIDKTITTIENILVFVGKEFDMSNEELLNQQSIALERLCGCMNINLNLTIEALGQEHSAVGDLNALCAIYDGLNCRIYDEVKGITDSKESVANWGIILQRARGQQITKLEGDIKHTHGANSDVQILGEGEQKRFFKAEDSIGNFSDVKKAAVDSVVSTEESAKFLDLLNNFEKTIKEQTVTDGKVNAYKQFVADFHREYSPDLIVSLQSELKALEESEWSPSKKINIEKLQTRIKSLSENQERLKKRVVDIIGEADFEKFAAILKKAFSIENTISLGEKAGIKSGANLMKRNIATEKMSRLFGMGGLIVHNKLESIEKDGKTTHGFSMENSGGVDFAALKKIIASDTNIQATELTQEASQQLIMLQFLDNLTGQIDRHRNNIHYIYEIQDVVKEEAVTHKKIKYKKLIIKSVKAIDNDMAFGNKFDITAKNMNTMGLFTPKNMKVNKKVSTNEGGRTINTVQRVDDIGLGIPSSISREFKRKLLGINADDIRETLAGLVEKEYIDSCVARFLALKRIILDKEYTPSTENGDSEMLKKHVQDINSRRPEGRKINFRAKEIDSNNSYYESRILESSEDGLNKSIQDNTTTKFNMEVSYVKTPITLPNGLQFTVDLNKYSDIKCFPESKLLQAVDIINDLIKTDEGKQKIFDEKSFYEEVANWLYTHLN